MNFFTGLHQPSDASHFDRACISINRIKDRKQPITTKEVMIDSGAFTEISTHGHYRNSVDTYADQLYNLYTRRIANIVVAVSQDYMCEPFIVEKTGLSVKEHQRLTVKRYDDLLAALSKRFNGSIPFHVLPVLQGYHVSDYVAHLALYGDRLTPGMWVGVGSVCKRQGNVNLIINILSSIKWIRPDLKLHGFGVKLTALKNLHIRALLETADSMAWSYAARMLGGNQNSWLEAKAFEKRIIDLC